MGVNIWVNRKQIYLDIYHHGQRHREKLSGLILTGDKQTDKETMRLAEIAKAKRAQQVFSEEWGLVDPIAGKQALYEYASRIDDIHIKQMLKHLKKYPGGQTIKIDQINEKWVESFQKYLLNDATYNKKDIKREQTGKPVKLAESSASAYANYLRIVLNRAVREKIIVRNPASGVKSLRNPEADRVHLTPDEIQRLADVHLGGPVGRDYKNAFLFACYTGLRISDLKTLTWGDIERSRQQIIKRQEKTKESVYIPMNDIAWKIINDGAIHNHKELVFSKMAETKCKDLGRLYKWAQRAGVDKKIGWHTARHTFAVMSLDSGSDIYTLSKLLGHKSVKTTEIYAKATDKMKRAAVDALPAVEIGNQ